MTPSLKWSVDRPTGRHVLKTAGGWSVAALVARDDGQWDGYLTHAPARLGPWSDLKHAKAAVKEQAVRALHGDRVRAGSPISGAEALRELAAWLAGMAQQLDAAADADGEAGALAAADVHLTALDDALRALQESPLRDPARSAHLMAAQPVVRAAMNERRHRDKPWAEWVVSGAPPRLSFLSGPAFGPQEAFAVVVARSAAEATDAVSAIFADRDVLRYSSREEMRAIASRSSLDLIGAEVVADGQDTSALPRLDLRQPWKSAQQGNGGPIL